MATVRGPLMSLDASGKFGNALTFGKWNGRNVVRRLVTPENPRTAAQMDARNHVRVMGAIQTFVNYSMFMRAGKMETDKAIITKLTPAGQAWNGYLVKAVVGPSAATIEASDAAFAALTAQQKADWDAAAAALDTPIAEVVQKHEFGVADTYKSAGNVFFNYAYGLAVVEKTAFPGAVPPVYA